MAGSLISNLKANLGNPETIKRDGFSLLAKLATLVNKAGETREVQDLLLRALEQRKLFGPAAEVLNALVRKQGLYPYLEPSELGFADRISYEVHRPDNLDTIVFHRVQAQVYRLLLRGQNVVLSAPTSFGKSLIIDAMVACGRFKNIAIIVPTIALIDETRRRLLESFNGIYKIITHSSQTAAERNIYVITQERAINFQNLPKIDFLVVDEFYKLDPGQQDSERSLLLNQAFYKLYSPSTQVYLLGPNIKGVSNDFSKKFNCIFFRTDYATVACEMTRITTLRSSRLSSLINLCSGLNEPTLIYCSSPASTRKVAIALAEGGIGANGGAPLSDAVEWVGSEYHPEWTFTKALQMGIGIHHGKVPRALSQFVVRAFNSGALRFLVCTSTLIEGVNTKAKNVIIYDHKIANKKLDYFTFNNIVGRSGRMFQHFIGRVFVFDDPPQEEFPFVRVPLADQSPDVPDSLLIQLNAEDLTVTSRERMDRFHHQNDLPIEILRANQGIDPDAQISLAREISGNPNRYHLALAWQGYPSYEQLEAVSNLIWQFFVGKGGAGAHSGVSSGRQLAFLVNRFRAKPQVSALIKSELERVGPDDAVEKSLEFLRYWVDFSFPRYLMALSRIQEVVFGRLRRTAGDYSYFAAQMENHFAPPGIIALDEYGIPFQVGLKLQPYLGACVGLDETLVALKSLDTKRVALSRFERNLIDNARGCI